MSTNASAGALAWVLLLLTVCTVLGLMRYWGIL